MVSNVNAIFVPEASIRHTIKTVLLDQSSLDRVEGGVYMDMLCWKSLVDSMLAKKWVCLLSSCALHRVYMCLQIVYYVQMYD